MHPFRPFDLLLLAVLMVGGSAKDDSVLQHQQHQQQLQRELNSYWTPDLAAAVSFDSRLSTLVTALKLANLYDTLKCNTWRYWLCTEYTVFAPINEAFSDDSVSEVVVKYTTNSDYMLHLTNLLLYHVSDEEILASDIQNGGMVDTLLQGETLETTISGVSTVLIDSAQVIQANIDVKNGVIHAIDSLLLPSFVTDDIATVASDAGIFTSLVEAANATGVKSDLALLEPLTVFAPTDDAFAAAADILAALSTDEIAEILRYHVIAGAILTSDRIQSGYATTLQGEDLHVRVRRGGGGNHMISLNIDTQVTDVDILASNGIIHVIDEVLIPPSIAVNAFSTIADIVAESDIFTTLEAALDSVGLMDTFNSSGSFTVFAPTDSAFALLGNAAVDDLLGTDALSDILQYHVLSEVVLFRDLEDGTLEALNGGIIGVSKFNNGGGVVYLNDNAYIESYDVRASNGIIHVINRVLIAKTVMEIVEERGYDSLIAAIDSVDGIRDTLSVTDGSFFTVFVPTNRAFVKLGDISGLSSDELAAVLTYHVVPSIVDDLETGSLTTLNGNTVDVEVYRPWWWFSLVNPRIYLKSPTVTARVLETDIYGSNGVIHIINRVLVPP